MLIRKFSLSSPISQNKRKRRKFVATGLDIEPYRKKQKMLVSGMATRNNVIRNEVPASLFSVNVNPRLEFDPICR